MVLEDKLADTAPKKPLALTLGAAAVTLAVIIGVLAGPSVVNCFNSEDGMGVCLRGKMTDAGLLPRTAVAATDAATPAVTETAPVTATPPADTATDIGEPALDVTEPAPAETGNDTLIAATFGLLRAEPDGSVVIAGSGTPGSEIEVYSNDDLLGTATVEPSGDWVLVPDAPIIPGGTEITLAEAGKTGRAAQSFVVVINDDKSSEPLVVASTPGAASDILQGLEKTVPATQMAAAAPVAAPAPVAPAAIPAAPAAPATTAPAAAPAPAAPAVVTPPPVEQPKPKPAPAAPAATAPAPAAPAATAPVAPAPAPVAAAAAAAPPVAKPSPPPAAPASPAPQVATAPAPVTPAAAPAAPAAPVAAPKPAVIAVPPTIDAIEIEGKRTFFAGGGTEGAAIRLYVDDSFIADATVADGRWLVEAGEVLTKQQQRVRIDMLAPGSAEVAARAEVNFEVQLPVTEAPSAIATAPAVEAPAAVATAPAAAAPTTVAEAPVAEAPVAETPVAEPVTAAVAPAIPTLVAVSVGGPDAERFASGKAIIRRGDNLWTIARRVYGEGIRYTTIYEANTGQIRDPDQIYPGQVFQLPN